MATHSSILAWRIPWAEEPDGLRSIGSQRVGHNWRDLAAAAAKTNHPVFWGYSLLLRYPYSICGEYLSLNKSTFLPITLSLTEFFLWWDIKNLSFSKVETRCLISVGRLTWLCGFKRQYELHGFISTWLHKAVYFASISLQKIPKSGPLPKVFSCV